MKNCHDPKYRDDPLIDHYFEKLMQRIRQLLDNWNDPDLLKALDEAADDYVWYLDEHYPLARPEDEYCLLRVSPRAAV